MKTERLEVPDQITLVFSGPIDEDSTFPDVPTHSKILLNLKNVDRINSCGIREWVLWFKQLPTTSQVTLVECPKVIIDQVNTVEDFVSPATIVESFFVPYYCDSCGSLTTKKVEVTAPMKIPDMNIECERCKKKAELDVVPEKYFKFLGRQR